jgi:hypothetical protein
MVALAVAIAIAISVAISIRHRHNRPSPLPLPLPLAIAVVVAVNHCRRHLCHVAINHCCCRHFCRWPLPSLSQSAIAITVSHHCHHAVSHFQELLPWCSKNCIQPIKAKNAYLILSCLDSRRHIDQSRMTDQVLSGNGLHQRWAASSKQ